MRHLKNWKIVWVKIMSYNILYIANESVLGGAALSLLDMLKALKNVPVNPIVIIPENGILEEQLRKLSIKYYIVSFSRGYGRIGSATREDENRNFKDNYAAALQLQDIIKAEQIDLIHINSSVTNVGAFAALMADIPYVWHLREVLEEHFESEFWDKPLKKELISRADSVITISEAVCDSYKEKYQIESVCIYDGVDIDKYKIELDEKAIEGSGNRFLITGNITENKGQLDAIKAIRILCAEGIKDVELVLVGHCNSHFLWLLLHYIKKHNLEKNVTILPFQENLQALRRNCSYSLTTSKFEALGRCTIEAMLAGQIVIGADTGGTKEIIGVNTKRGYLYEQGNYKSLAEIMKRVLEEENIEKEEYRKNAQKYAVNNFAFSQYCGKLMNLYHNVLENKMRETTNIPFTEELEKRYRSLESSFVEETRERRIIHPNSQSIQSNWQILEQRGEWISTFLWEKGYKKVAIYGMGYFGRRLYDELIYSKITVSYIIDKNPGMLGEIVTVKSPEDIMDEVDLLIVAVAREEKEIVDKYRNCVNFEVRALSEILDEAVSC